MKKYFDIIVQLTLDGKMVWKTGGKDKNNSDRNVLVSNYDGYELILGAYSMELNGWTLFNVYCVSGQLRDDYMAFLDQIADVRLGKLFAPSPAIAAFDAKRFVADLYDVSYWFKADYGFERVLRGLKIHVADSFIYVDNIEVNYPMDEVRKLYKHIKSQYLAQKLPYYNVYR